jgi:hypothetical protein
VKRNVLFLPFIFFCILPAAAETPRQPFNAPGRYEIQCVVSGQLLDVSASNNTKVQQYPRNDGANQQWDIRPARGGYFYIRSVATGKLLSLAGNRNREGAHVVVYPRNGREDQLWRIVSVAPAKFKIISKYGRMLDVPDGSHDRGKHLQIWDPRHNENQLFRFVLVSAASRSAYRDIHPSAPLAPREQEPRRGSPGWRRERDARACRAEVSRHIMDLPASQIAVEPVSRDQRGNWIVTWHTPRASSGFCRVNPSGRIVQFKVEEMSQ